MSLAPQCEYGIRAGIVASPRCRANAGCRGELTEAVRAGIMRRTNLRHLNLSEASD
jgi:hypothetical protein